jgi:hypothetical protein
VPRDQARRLVEWLLGGERCMVSESIVRARFGMPPLPHCDGPYTVFELRRCFLLLERFPEWQAWFHRHMPQVSKRRAVHIGHWNELRALMVRDLGADLSGRLPTPDTVAQQIAITKHLARITP